MIFVHVCAYRFLPTPHNGVPMTHPLSSSSSSWHTPIQRTSKLQVAQRSQGFTFFFFVSRRTLVPGRCQGREGGAHSSPIHHHLPEHLHIPSFPEHCHSFCGTRDTITLDLCLHKGWDAQLRMSTSPRCGQVSLKFICLQGCCFGKPSH